MSTFAAYVTDEFWQGLLEDILLYEKPILAACAVGLSAINATSWNDIELIR